MIDLGTLGGDFGIPNALNNHGQVIGTMSLADQKLHPFLWNRGLLTDLGTLGGDNGQAFWINESGDVIGSADLPASQVHHAFLWKHGIMTDLGTPDGDACSTAHHINSKGQVVGNSGVCGVGGHAFLWERSGSAVDLDTLVLPGSDLQVINAFFINDAGEIVCRGKLANGDRHICLLIPTGEEEDPDRVDTIRGNSERKSTLDSPFEIEDQGNEARGRRIRQKN